MFALPEIQSGSFTWNPSGILIDCRNFVPGSIEHLKGHSVVRNIDIYELPDQSQDLAFRLYEVKGRTIANAGYPHKTDRPHRHTYYEICMFINGVGRHEIDFRTYSIRSHSVHFLSPGQVHLISREKNYHGYLMVFSREFYSLGVVDQDLLSDFPFFNNNTSEPILNLEEPQFAQLLALINMIRLENPTLGHFTRELLRSYLHTFLLKCKEFYAQSAPGNAKWLDPRYQKVKEFKELVENHFQMYHYVKDYASLMGTTPALLNKQVKNMTDMNASEIIHNRISLEIKRLLIHTDLTNKEIAYRLHFEDPSYFNRFFRKKEGMTPSAFRAAMSKKYQK